MVMMDMNGHYIEYYNSMMSIDHIVICKTATVIVITRCIFFWAHRFLNNYSSFSSIENESPTISSSSSVDLSLEMARQNINSTTFGDIEDKLNHNVGSCKKSCAVCLETFTRKSKVSELCNCGHVFHRGCLDRWLRYDTARMTCPLCRTNVMSSQLQDPVLVLQQQQPNWAVERILYMFGDDLSCHYNSSCSSSSS